MLICKYTRLGGAAFVPHLDTLRAVTMAIRRIGAEVEFSEGYNPHLKIYFGQPLPIGVESECEYFCVYAHEKPRDFMERLNSSLPSGLKIAACGEAEKDPNVANMMYFADYTATMRDVTPDLRKLGSFFGQDECVIEYEQKGKTVQKDVKRLVSSFEATDERTVKMRLRCGNVNLRADRLMNFLCARYGLGKFDIVKNDMYDCNGINLDKILFGSNI